MEGVGMSKDAIVREIRGEVDAFYAEVGTDRSGGSCIYLTLFGCAVLAKHGILSVPVGGSLSWPFKDEDDGKGPTHFSYLWSPNDINSVLAFLGGGLPEMHAWLITKEMDLIDVTTNEILVQCREIAGLERTAPLPPDYVWGKPPEGAIYEPSVQATAFLLSIPRRQGALARFLGKRYGITLPSAERLSRKEVVSP